MSKYQQDLIKSEEELFSQIRSSFLDYDPAHFVENNLTIDGQSFKIIGNGWKFMADIYRYIALQATTGTGKPVVLCKGRQIGATMMAGALDLYLTNSGLFSNPPIRVLHAFPSLAMVKKFTQDKLEGMVRTAKDDFINKNKLHSTNAVDNLTMKQFNTGTIWVDSLGRDADRIRGMTTDAIFFDECFPYNQNIEIEGGKKIFIGKIYDMYKNNKTLPKIKSFNESSQLFEYKSVINAWNRGEKELIEVVCNRRKIKCTENHLFLTDSGWKKAKELTSNDLLVSSFGGGQMSYALGDEQHQVVLGSFLGNGHLDNYANKKYRLSVIHSEKQTAYCSWKASLFDSKLTLVEENRYAKNKAIKFTTKGFGLSNKISSEKKYCPPWILKDLTAIGIAIWYMDKGSSKFWNNGSSESGSGSLSTHSFDEKTQEMIVEKFKNLGIQCHYKSYNHGGSDFFFIYFKKNEFDKLCKLIAPYIHPSIEYKILKKYRSVKKHNWNANYKEYRFLSINDVHYLNQKEIVYDIEVKDNHNFVVTSSNRAKNAGGPLAHNCQEMYGLAIGNATKILTAAKYGPVGKGVQVYFGTPKERSSFFHSIWELSDQRYYHLGCTNCKQTFPFYLSGDDRWKHIWVDGFIIQCPLCGHRQHKIEAIENGAWVPTKDPETAKYVGYHINQLYLPQFPKQNILDLMPENNPTQSMRVWNNEVIGEFYSGAGLPLTKADIYEHCRDADRCMARRIDSREKKTYLGVDWGGKVENDNIDRGQSFSCIVVLSAQHDGTLLVEHTHKIGEHGFRHKIATIKECYRRFGIIQGVSDHFYGNDVVSDLQLLYHSKFLGAQGSGSLVKPLKYREDELIIGYNKDLLIDEIFDKFRKGKIRFPWGSYEHIEWLIDHCTSMEMGVRMSGGQQIKTYKKGSIPNDGLMALLYAYIAWKFDITHGFSIKPGIDTQPTMIRPFLVHLPRLK